MKRPDPRSVHATKLENLPERMVRFCVAVTTSWKCNGRAPCTHELDRLIGVEISESTILNLIARGWLTTQWRTGRRVPATLRPSLKLIRQLYPAEYDVESAAE